MIGCHGCNQRQCNFLNNRPGTESDNTRVDINMEHCNTDLSLADIFDRPSCAFGTSCYSEDLDAIFLEDVDRHTNNSTDGIADKENWMENLPQYLGHTSFCSSNNNIPPLVDNMPTIPMYNQTSTPSSLYQNFPNVSYLNPMLCTSSASNRCYEENSDSVFDLEQTPRKGRRKVLLWKFLLKTLSDPGCTTLCWENKGEGIFRFVDTNAVAKLWGQQKQKQDMNFEKLSRGIRHYYKPGMMGRVEGKRLVYKFNWKKFSIEDRPSFDG